MFRRLPLYALWITLSAITIALRSGDAQLKPPEFKPAPEVPAMPKALIRLPRTNITRAEFPAVDIHFHGRSLRTPEDYQKTIQMMDESNLAVISDMDGGFGPGFDQAINPDGTYIQADHIVIEHRDMGVDEVLGAPLPLS